MQALSFAELDSERDRYDEIVARTPEIDRFCTSSLWVLPAITHLMPPSEPHILRAGEGYSVFARSWQDGARLLHPLEALWGLACPFVAPEPFELVETIHHDASWDALVVTGVVESSRLFHGLLEALGREVALFRGRVTNRFVADLEGGIDGFLSRRTAGFRASLKKAERRGRERGLRYEVADDQPADRSFGRLVEIEKRSWKGLRGVGIDRTPMRDFYLDMNERLVARGARRLLFAKVDDRDAGYILGGVFGDSYRGLQFSFDARFSDLSLGNLCQLEEIRRSCDAGLKAYDLGTEVAYKKRWGERVFSTTSLVIERS